MNEMQNPRKDNHTFPSGNRAKQSNILLGQMLALGKYFWPGDTDKTNHSAS